MNLLPYLYANDARKHAQNLALLAANPSTLTKAGFFALFPGVFDASDQFTPIPGGAANSRGAVVWNTTEMLVIINGTYGTQNLAALLASWADGARSPTDETQPAVFPAAWAAYLAAEPAIANIPYTKITLIGHSYGGGTAMAAVAWLRGIHRTMERHTFTYGAPRVSTPQGFSNWSGESIDRVWLARDPVVNVPPHTPENPLLFGVLGNLVQRRMNSVWQPMGGIELDDEGNWTPLEASHTNAIYQFGPLANWLTGNQVFESSRHSLAAYVAAVNASVARVPNQSPAVAPRHGDRARLPPPNDLRRMIGSALETSGRNTAADLDVAAVEILSATTLIPGVKFRTKSIYGARVITYNGITVASTPKRRTQKMLIRRLNGMIPKSLAA